VTPSAPAEPADCSVSAASSIQAAPGLGRRAALGPGVEVHERAVDLAQALEQVDGVRA
jgi:hypothetical protein